MNICGSVCVLAIIFIGAFCAKLNPRKYLIKYGYLTKILEYSTPKLRSFKHDNLKSKGMKNAILKFQKFNGLPQTSILDKATFNKMCAPRCGVPDLHPNGYGHALKTRTTNFTWMLTKYSKTSKLSPRQQRLVMYWAFKRWTAVTPLIIEESKYSPGITISFERGDHGDPYPFDTKDDDVLAHALSPPFSFIHFNDDQNWVMGTTDGYDLETVAAHEMGHVLGLDHSNDPKALMAPYSRNYSVNFKLHPDDVARIQNLYGKNRIKFCGYRYNKIYAAMRIKQSDFVFVDNGEVIDGRTGKRVPVRSLFPRGPYWVEAATYAKIFNQVYLFKDGMFWAYSVNYNGTFSLLDHYPKQFFTDIIDGPECAMDDFSNDYVLLVKNGYYFKFLLHLDIITSTVGEDVKSIFKNIPSKIDAAISDNFEINFIVGMQAFTMSKRDKIVSRHGTPVNMILNDCHR